MKTKDNEWYAGNPQRYLLTVLSDNKQEKGLSNSKEL